MSVRDVDTAWPSPAADGGARLLDEVHSFLCQYVAFPSPETAIAVSLWATHTHAVQLFDSTPRLALLSPEPGSGKTRTLEVLALLCPAPLHVLNASTAAVFRVIDSQAPTLLFDEVDAIFGRRGKDDSAEDLRGLLNAGHSRGARIPRCVGQSQEVRLFEVYAPVALAGLGDLPDTLMSRSIVVRMRRRAPNERVSPFRRRDASPGGDVLRERLAVWATDNADLLGAVRPDMPDGIEDRPADVWEPLLAVADVAGGHWPRSARAACLTIVKMANAGDSGSLGVRLLSDLWQIFGDADKLTSETILERLCQLDEAPWGDLRGKALDYRGLARRLSQYGVSSRDVRTDDRVCKGYTRADLWDTWTRYLPPLGFLGRNIATSATPATIPVSEQPRRAVKDPAPLDPALSDAGERAVGTSATTVGSATTCHALARNVASVADVAHSASGDPQGRAIGAACSVCTQPLDRALSDAGERSHPNCQVAA